MILDSFITHKKTFALDIGGKVVGSLGIESYKEEEFPELDVLCGRSIGYVLSKDYWGQGLMPEAVKAMAASAISKARKPLSTKVGMAASRNQPR